MALPRALKDISTFPALLFSPDNAASVAANMPAHTRLSEYYPWIVAGRHRCEWYGRRHDLSAGRTQRVNIVLCPSSDARRSR